MRFQKFPGMSRRGHTFLNTRNDGLWKSDQSWGPFLEAPGNYRAR